MDWSTVLTSVTGELSDNAATVAGVAGLVIGVGFVLRLVKRAAR